MIDFDISIMFPTTSTTVKHRLPSNLAWDGGYNQLHDTWKGEVDYDPFAYDVGCLGILFCDEFQVRLIRQYELGRVANNV